jgi:hypothetical protein
LAEHLPVSAAGPFRSADYWDARYRGGGTAGAGSTGVLARFKAGVVNGFVTANAIHSVIDMGCGDGSQLELLQLPADYIGVDPSPAALALCAARFPERRFVSPEALPGLPQADLTLSLDVIYHLVEDDVFAAAMHALFDKAARFVVIYASNQDAVWSSPHVRHRRFTDHVSATQRDWRLLAHLPNPWPFDPARPNDTSFADFFIFGKAGESCSIVVPATG